MDNIKLTAAVTMLVFLAAVAYMIHIFNFHGKVSAYESGQEWLAAAKLPATTPSDGDLSDIRTIYLAGGCFWGVEAFFARLDGVIDAVPGYANGKTQNPSYEDLIYRNSGHAETVKVTYDSAKITLDELLVYFFRIIDPVSVNRQGNDIGAQYRTGIYYADEREKPVIDHRIDIVQSSYSQPVAVEVKPLVHFFEAEDYHQDYLAKNPDGYCHINLNAADEPVIRKSWYPKPDDSAIRMMLTDEQYRVTQLSGTEACFTNPYDSNYDSGIYVDIVTGEPLFSSRDKYKSGSGWPSFVKPIADYVVVYRTDYELGYPRTEVRSRSGNSHLGHVFEDGPSEKGGLRYCINSAALKFVPLSDMENLGYGYLIKQIAR